jgi:hypothetical protein
MSNHIKRLSLEYWMELGDQEGIGIAAMKIVRELIGNGWYYDRLTKTSWYEVDGNTYTTKHLASRFIYCLSLFDVEPFTDEQVRAIHSLIRNLTRKQKNATRELQNMLQKDLQAKNLRNIGRDARRFFFRIK